MLIPSTLCHRLHWEVGDEVVLHIKDGEVRIVTPCQALRKVQAIVKNYMNRADNPVSLVDELIAMRRAEAVREE